jgi:dihydroflavonol-4-reductase
MTGTVLVTGATGFLGYHVVKLLNEHGVRPRVLELPGSTADPLAGLDVQRCAGHLGDPQATADACAGVDTLLHLAFKVSIAGGAQATAEMERVNVAGSRQLLECAASRGVRRAVVVGSALAVGVNRRPEPLDEDASWDQHGFDARYALVRRSAEHTALAQATADFAVVSVCPAFTLGPDDPVGAPANKMLRSLVAGKLRFAPQVGFGVLDVRDFAAAMLLAAERGRSGRRYLLSGENVTTEGFLRTAARLAGTRAPRLRPPALLLHAAVVVLATVSRLRGRPAPIDRSLLRIIGRFAWYDTSRARSELGWCPRPLGQSLADTIGSLRSEVASGAVDGPGR